MKNPSRVVLAALLSAVVTVACGGGGDSAPTPLPSLLVLGHRGMPAARPEHTLASYSLAIDSGANFIEPDLVSTKDGVLVTRHENEISTTTNVASLSQFASRRTTKTIDNVPLTGWFTEDFTLAELKTLRAIERIPANRPANQQFDGQFEVPTLQEVIDLAQRRSRELGRTIGIYPETKHPSYFKAIGLPLERRLVDALNANGYRGRTAPVFIQSFEVANLREIRGMTDVPIVQLIAGPTTQPEDLRLAGSSRTYADLITPAGLADIKTYADGIGPPKDLVIPRDANNNLGTPTALVSNARTAGLLVHPYTFRPENPFLPANLRRGNVNSLTDRGDEAAELAIFLATGITGFFTDDSAIGRAAADAFCAGNAPPANCR